MLTDATWMSEAPYHVPAADVPQVHDNVHLRGPQLDLPLPGGDRRERHHQQERSVQLVLVKQVVEKADGLDGLPQPHLISQDTAVTSGNEQRREAFRT